MDPTRVKPHISFSFPFLVELNFVSTCSTFRSRRRQTLFFFLQPRSEMVCIPPIVRALQCLHLIIPWWFVMYPSTGHGLYPFFSCAYGRCVGTDTRIHILHWTDKIGVVRYRPTIVKEILWSYSVMDGIIAAFFLPYRSSITLSCSTLWHLAATGWRCVCVWLLHKQ
jgi:hypothetical protein